jgi:cysteine desulfurase
MAFMFLSLGASLGQRSATDAMIYLDANATEPLRPEARAASLEALDLVGNPASIHAAGRAARRILEGARTRIAARFGAAPADLVFTSGGTEANALAIAGLAAGRPVIVGATEHDAVRAAAPSDATILPVTRGGQADLAALASLLERTGPALVCLMLANNETGVLHPIKEAAALCRAHGARLHVDAVQAAGRLDFTVAALGANSLAISAHKIGGPKGAGALILAPDIHLPPQIAGGGQERGRRGGTQALPAIAGFAAALDEAGDAAALARLRDQAERQAVSLGAVVCGDGPRLPNTTCLALPGRRADLQVIALDLAGIAVSAGAACSSGKVTDSHVLRAMGLDDLAGCAIRVSLPWNTQEKDITAFIAAYQRLARPTGEAPCPPAPPSILALS